MTAYESPARTNRSSSFITKVQESYLWLKLLVPTALIVIAEGFLFVHNLEMTALFHGLNLLLCILVPVLLRDDPTLWEAFSMPSILRLLNLGMPTFTTSTLLWFPLIYAPAILVGLFIVHDQRKSIIEHLGMIKRFLNTEDLWKGLEDLLPADSVGGRMVAL